jgi:hypothetical protein
MPDAAGLLSCCLRKHPRSSGPNDDAADSVRGHCPDTRTQAMRRAKIASLLSRSDPASRLVGNWVRLYERTAVSELTSVQIKRVSRISYEDFQQNFDRPQIPVVITDATEHWRAMRVWSNEWFGQHYGSTEVQLSAEHTHTTRSASMSLGQYINLILSGTERGLYMDQFSMENLPGLRDDIATPYLNSRRRNVALNLWLGPAGTFIGLHKDNHTNFDYINNIFAQIRGRKRVVLVAPEYDALMYPRTREQGAYWHSQVDWRTPDFARFPLFRGVTVEVTTVCPRELLFIPGNYWHSLASLDQSISVSCWWRVHRIADLVLTAVADSGRSAAPSELITCADVEEFGGFPRLVAALESDTVLPELRALVWKLMSNDVRNGIDASRARRLDPRAECGPTAGACTQQSCK